MNTFLITLDWDIPFETRSKYVAYNHLFKFLRDNKIKYFYERHSSRNNTHIKFNMNNISILDSFCIRALLKDDKNRLLIDLMRYYKNMEINRLWDCKFKNGKELRAGNWVRVYV